MKSSDTHQIGQVAERLGLSMRTIRYYEEMGLIEPSSRSEGGFRLYSDEDIGRLDLIKQMKPLGFTVQEMRDLLAALDQLEGPSASDAGAQAALARLKAFSASAQDKTEHLRAQLEMAEDFASGLKRQLRRHRRRVPGEPARAG